MCFDVGEMFKVSGWVALAITEVRGDHGLSIQYAAVERWFGPALLCSALAPASVNDKATTDSHPFFLKRHVCQLSLTLAEAHRCVRTE